MSGFVCADCGRDASVHVFIAESAWKQIAPNPDGRTGVLCLYCMSARLATLGWPDNSAPATISSGPLATIAIPKARQETAEGDAPVAYGAPHQPWCQPGDQPHRAFRLRFEDPDMCEMVWTGPDAEAEALAAYNRYAPAWNVYLFSGHPRTHPTPATPAVKGEVTDEWAERFCEAVNWSPDGQECKTVEGQLRCVSFRDLAKGYILAAIATDPCTPATPEGLREALGRSVVFNAYSADDPLALRFEFETEEDRLAAANAVDAALQPQAQE